MAVSQLFVVVEGRTDAQVLRALLGSEVTKNSRFFAAQGKMSLATLARNVLVHEGGPVLIVADADTTKQRLVEEQRGLLRVALENLVPGLTRGEVGAGDRLVNVFLFVPEIEVLLFEAETALERLVGHPVPAEVIQQGLLLPTETLNQLLLGNGSRHAGDLLPTALADPELLPIISAGKQATELRELVDALFAPALAAP